MAYGQANDNQVFSDAAGRTLGGTPPWDDPIFPRVTLQKAIDRRDPGSLIYTREQCLEGKTKTLFIDFAELGRPGYSTMVDREMNCSATLMGALTYGRTESFDVDLFGATRVWPAFGWLFGAGVRWRIAP